MTNRSIYSWANAVYGLVYVNGCLLCGQPNLTFG